MFNKTLSVLTLIHRWGGLIGGWFCFFLVVTGTVSVFDLEISRWMQPELAEYLQQQDVSEASIQTAYHVWQENTEQKKFSFVVLPTDRYPFVHVLYSQGLLLHWQNIDPATGKIIETNPTVGGYFFDSLHNNLLMGHPLGDIVIIVLSVLFLIFIISGFFIHLKHLWKEFFKIRPKASALRFVLDIHIGIGVFFLPFLTLMVVSGFLFYAPIFMPFLNPAPNHYETAAQLTSPVKAMNTEKNLYSVVKQAKETFHSMPGFILLMPNEIHVVQSDADQLAIMRNYIELNQKNNKVSLMVNHPTLGRYLYNLLFGLHLVRSGGDVMRWIYFLAGVGASILVATGLLFFSNKRRHFNKKHVSENLLVFYKVIDGLHVGMIMGVLLSLVAVFWANMIDAFIVVNKPFWEITAFLSVLSLSFIEGMIYSFYSSVIKAWKHQIALFAGLCLLLPITKMILYPAILNFVWKENFVYTIMNVVFIGMGFSFCYLYYYLQRKPISGKKVKV